MEREILEEFSRKTRLGGSALMDETMCEERRLRDIQESHQVCAADNSFCVFENALVKNT